MESKGGRKPFLAEKEDNHVFLLPPNFLHVKCEVRGLQQVKAQ